MIGFFIAIRIALLFDKVSIPEKEQATRSFVFISFRSSLVSYDRIVIVFNVGFTIAESFNWLVVLKYY
jgi:hypothetical protein